MPEIIFSYVHAKNDLVVKTGANEIEWNYVLNTQTYPTYGGEVVQLLSTKIDVLNITGEVGSYRKMEQIYRWFINYFQHATQGFRGVGSEGYNEDPVVMKYPHRGWTMLIQPMKLPGLMYGREVVAPKWQMTAHIVQPDPEQTELTIAAGLAGMKDFGSLTANIGFRRQNPFSDPMAVLDAKEREIFSDYEQHQAKEWLTSAGKRLAEQMDAYLAGDYEDAMNAYGIEASKPARNTGDDEVDEEKPGGKKDT